MTTTTEQHHLADPPRSGANLTLSWGLVVIPAKVYNGTAEGPTWRSQFSKAGNPVGSQPYDKVTGEPVERSEIVKKAQASDGTFVELTDDEMAEAVAAGGRSKGSAAIEALIPVEAIGTAYLAEGIGHVRAAPIGSGKNKIPNPAAEKGLNLLLAALAERGKAALVYLAGARGAQPAAIMPDGTLLKLRYAEEVRPAPALPQHDLSAAELELACKLIDSMPVDQPVLRDDTATRLRTYVDDKAAALAAGKPVPTVEAAADVAPVVDLMAAMQQSLDAATAQKGKRGRKAS